MLCAKFQNDCTIEMGVMDGQDFTRFEFTISFIRIYYNAPTLVPSSCICVTGMWACWWRWGPAHYLLLISMIAGIVRQIDTPLRHPPMTRCIFIHQADATWTEHWSISFRWPLNCLFKNLSGLTTQKDSKLCIAGCLCWECTWWSVVSPH